MKVAAFDTHNFVKRLKAAQFSEAQAEALAESMAELLEGNLATKTDIVLLQRDLKEIEANLRRDLKELEAKISRDLKELEAKVSRDLKELDTKAARDLRELELRLRHDLTLRLGAMMVTGIAVVAALVKLL